MNSLIKSLLIVGSLLGTAVVSAQELDPRVKGTQKIITLPADIDEKTDISIATLIEETPFLEELKLEIPFVTIKMAIKRNAKVDIDMIHNIAKAIEKQTKLRNFAFDFSLNKITPEEVISITESVKKMTNLETLSVKFNTDDIGNDEIEAITDSIKNLQKLKTLSLTIPGDSSHNFSQRLYATILQLFCNSLQKISIVPEGSLEIYRTQEEIESLIDDNHLSASSCPSNYAHAYSN